MNALLPKRRGYLSACALATLIATSLLQSALASTFTLQSNTVILEEREGRTAFTVSNPGREPILLLSRVDDLDDQQMAGNVLVTPAVTRIDPGQSQVINFALKKGTALQREYLLRASFEGVTQKAEHGMRMPIRQQIGFILQPRALAVSPAPWQDLELSLREGQLRVHNSGRHVIRMGPTLQLEPAAGVATLPHPYVMPGESMDLPVEGLGRAEQVQIIPLSRYGFARDVERLPLVP